MRRFTIFALQVALVCSTTTMAQAGEREDYLICITDELGRGTDLAEIGDLCLNEVRPLEGRKKPQSDAEQYPYEETLRRVLVDQGSLFDPDSARFKDLVYSKRFSAWCGQINAKNRLGGYVGWEYFALRDRYRGLGKRPDYIDLDIGAKPLIERKCLSYQAWDRTKW